MSITKEEIDKAFEMAEKADSKIEGNRMNRLRFQICNNPDFTLRLIQYVRELEEKLNPKEAFVFQYHSRTQGKNYGIVIDILRRTIDLGKMNIHVTEVPCEKIEKLEEMVKVAEEIYKDTINCGETIEAEDEDSILIERSVYDRICEALEKLTALRAELEGK